MSDTYRVPVVAEKLDTSEWVLRRAINDGTFPFPVVRIGRRIVIPRAPIDQFLGIAPTDDEAPASMPGPVCTATMSPHPLTTERQVNATER